MTVGFAGTARFRVIRPLGVGGMGAVYEAFDREQRTRIALKTLLHLTPHAIERFKREFRALQGVQHPNLVTLGELFEDGGRWFFTMELIEGGDLLAWVRPSGVLDVARLRAALGQLAGALHAIHGAGKVHRDVKPSNVKVTPGGRVTLLDFGLARDTDGDALLSGDQVVGTAAYMAPEQAVSGQVGPEADWYAFGIVLHEALTGRLPFTGPPLQIMLDKQRREPAPPAGDDVPTDLAALTAALLRFDRTARPGGAAILEALGATSPATPPASLPTSPFVGRVAELERLAAAFEDARRGEAVVVAIQGESGVGKTALVRRFVEQLVGQVPELIVLSGRCYESESVPYKALDGAMEDLARHLKRLDPVDAALIAGGDAARVVRLFPVLGTAPVVRRAAGQPLPWAGGEPREVAFAAVRQLFGRLGERQPVVVVIDDLQWADNDSLALLDDLLAAPGAPRLLVLITSRPKAAPLATLTRLLPGVRLLELGGLPDDDARTLAALLSQRLDAGVDPADLARETEGHPLFLHELVRHVATLGHAAGVRLDEALALRIDALDPPARRLLEVLAVADAPLPLRLASAAAELDPGLGVRMASLLRVAMLARSVGQRADDLIEPYHDRVRATVVARLAARAAAIHGRLADALDEAGAADPRLLVRHLESAGDAARASELAVRAAARASDALAFDRAAELYRTALRLGRQPVAERRRLHVALGDALAGAGRCAEAADAYLEAVDDKDEGARLDLRRRAAEQLLVGGDVERGLTELGSLLAELGLRLPATTRGALGSLVLGRLRLRLRGLRWSRRDPGRVMPRDLQVLELHRTVATGLSHIDYVRGADFNTRTLLLAMRAGQPVHVASSLLLHAALRAAEGGTRQGGVADLLRQVEAICDDTGDPQLRARLHGTQGVSAYFAGRFAEALPLLERAETELRGQRSDSVWHVNNFRLFGLFALHYLGRYGELARRVERHAREARRGSRYQQAALARGLNMVWVARGQVDLARELLETTWAPPAGDFYQLLDWYRFLARGTLALHDRRIPDELFAELARIERSLLVRIQLVRVETSRLAGQLAVVRGDREEARRRARRLRHERVGYATLAADLLDASLDPSPETLRVAAETALREGNPLTAAAVGVFQGDADAVARVRAEGVDPDIVARLVLPQFTP